VPFVEENSERATESAEPDRVQHCEFVKGVAGNGGALLPGKGLFGFRGLKRRVALPQNA
jgi:hypothetical protein